MEDDEDGEPPVDDLGQEDNDEDDSNEDDFTMHKQQLEELKEKDPEFYKYLLENDKRLLEFGEASFPS